MKPFRQHRGLLDGQVVVTEIDPRVMPKIFKVPILGKRSCRQMKHSQWIASQGMQGCFLCDPIGAGHVRFQLLPSIHEMVRGETLAVSRRQLFDVKLITLFDDLRQTLV